QIRGRESVHQAVCGIGGRIPWLHCRQPAHSAAAHRGRRRRQAGPISRSNLMSKQDLRRLNRPEDARRVGRPAFASESARVLAARPQALYFDPASTALIVVDMQNAYISAGGYMDRAGFDISLAAGAVAGTRRAVDLARASGIQVVYLQNGWDAQYVEAGGRSEERRVGTEW